MHLSSRSTCHRSCTLSRIFAFSLIAAINHPMSQPSFLSLALPRSPASVSMSSFLPQPFFIIKYYTGFVVYEVLSLHRKNSELLQIRQALGATHASLCLWPQLSKDHDPLKANLCRFTQYNQVYFREIKRPKSVLIARGHIPLDLPDIIQEGVIIALRALSLFKNAIENLT